ncbi:carbohydrate kinase [Massarina eburnea CBS 473.64]|uniref:Gluconokinase n=1 Tax=Massarina eburnea CBS 473.64 TaxID=1395130 RepID=A0A6A6RRI7_9PLEO|nr:carbohydrate kinase [Massarina eburnea CBS 473.64]
MMQTTEPPHINAAHYAVAPTPPIATPSNITSSANTVKQAAMSIKSNQHILIVTGPAGCGKSTVAKGLSDRYAFKYIEGDEFHPPENVQKMENNVPLTDADRWDWLILLRNEALESLASGSKGVVVTCSALKKKYRDVIRGASLYSGNPNANVHFVYLRASKETLLARVAARQGHYMKEAMVISQLAALEEPDDDEINKIKDVQIIDVTGSLEQVSQLAAAAVDSIIVR